MIDLGENRINDATNSPEKIAGIGFEMSQSGDTDRVIKNLDGIAHAVGHDDSVTVENLDHLSASLSGMKVSINGTEMTARELEKIPDIMMNTEIWKEIKAGDFGRTEEMTLITDEIAELLSSRGKGDPLNLSGLKIISDTVAEILSRHEGGGLVLKGLTELSDIAAEKLSHHKGGISLEGLTSISPTAAKYLSRIDGYLGLEGLSALPDTVAEHLRHHKDELYLDRLIDLSDRAALYLGLHEGKIWLYGLSSISDIAAQHLADHIVKNRGTIHFRNHAVESKVNSFLTYKT